MKTPYVDKLLQPEGRSAKLTGVANLLQTILSKGSSSMPEAEWFSQFRSLCEVAALTGPDLGASGRDVVQEVVAYVSKSTGKPKRKLDLLAVSAVQGVEKAHAPQLKTRKRERETATAIPSTTTPSHRSPRQSASAAAAAAPIEIPRPWELPFSCNGVFLERVGNENPTEGISRTPSTTCDVPSLQQVELVPMISENCDEAFTAWRQRQPRKPEGGKHMMPNLNSPIAKPIRFLAPHAATPAIAAPSPLNPKLLTSIVHLGISQVEKV